MASKVWRILNAIGLVTVALCLIGIGQVLKELEHQQEEIDSIPAAIKMSSLSTEDKYAELYRTNADRIARLEKLHME